MHDDPAAVWLLASEDPSVRYLTLTEVLDEPLDSPEAAAARELIPSGPRVSALLSGQEPDGGFGVHPYRKWTGAHWRLVSLAELALPPGDPRVERAIESVLSWVTRIEVATPAPGQEVRVCASMQGNALAACCRFGMAEDERVQGLAARLIRWQWADGGWNCDKRSRGHHSSFYETLAPLWGLAEYYGATSDRPAREAAGRAREFFLRHRLFRSDHTGEIINAEWLKLHYPLYWHYDVLQGLLILSHSGPLDDPRTGEALDVIEQKRMSDGRWRPGNYYWKRPGSGPYGTEAADWGRGGPNEMITLNALRVLKAAGRLDSL